MRWENDWTGFFLIYFKWCYFLCVTPFRFEWDEQRKKFRLEKNRIQEMACALQYIMLGVWYFKNTRKIPVDSLYKNPDVYFSLAFNLNAIYYHIGVLAFCFWRRQDRFLALVNFECGSVAMSRAKNKFTAVFLCFLFAVFPLLYTLSGFQVIPSSVLWNPSLMFRCLVVEGRFAFFLNVTSREPCNDNNPPALDELCLIDLIVGVLAFLMETARQVLGFYSDFFPLICCLSLWTSVGALQEYLEIEDNDYIHQHQHKHFHSPKMEEQRTSCNGNGRIMLPYIFPSSSVITSSTPTTSTPLPLPSTDEASSCQKEKIESSHSGFQSSLDSSEVGNILLERYEVCKAFSRTVNRALGQLLFAYVLSSIMYLSTCMDAVLVLQDWFGKLRVAFFFFVFILMFFIGSEIVNKVYGLRVWLSTPTNNAFLSERNLLVLIQELTCKSIGVSGNGMFTITYSTFMTVMTTTVTFFIIILQFQKPDREELSATLRTFMIHFANRTQLLDV